MDVISVDNHRSVESSCSEWTISLSSTAKELSISCKLPLEKVPIALIATPSRLEALSTFAKQHKHSRVWFLRIPVTKKKMKNSIPIAVFKLEDTIILYQHEYTMLSVFLDTLLNLSRCLHVPRLIGSTEPMKRDRGSVLTSYAGQDLLYACDNHAVNSEMDLISILVQLCWTYLVVGDLIGVYHGDFDASKVCIETAPFGGYWHFSMELRHPNLQPMVATLKTRVKVTLVDWADFKFCLPHSSSDGLDSRLTAIYKQSKQVSTNNSSAKRHFPNFGRITRSSPRRLLANPLSSNLSSNFIVDAWNHICEQKAIRTIINKCGDNLTGNVHSRLDNVLSSIDGRGVQLWRTMVAALACEHGVESLHFIGFASKLENSNMSLRNFNIREYQSWIPEPTEDIELPVPKRRKRRARTAAERDAKYRKKKKEREMEEKAMKESGVRIPPPIIVQKKREIYVPGDSLWTSVRPGVSGLGVFARKCIPAGTVITRYSGLYGRHNAIEEHSWMDTHVYTVEHGADRHHIDGIRFPIFGQGVASLVNTVSEEVPNAKFILKRTTNVTSIPTLEVVTSRKIKAGEEILIDYKISETS